MDKPQASNIRSGREVWQTPINLPETKDEMEEEQEYLNSQAPGTRTGKGFSLAPSVPIDPPNMQNEIAERMTGDHLEFVPGNGIIDWNMMVNPYKSTEQHDWIRTNRIGNITTVVMLLTQIATG